MMLVIIGLGGAAVGSWFGWRSGTRDLYRFSLDPLDPPMSRALSDPRRRARGKRRRMAKTFLFGVVGFAVALVLLFALVRR